MERGSIFIACRGETSQRRERGSYAKAFAVDVRYRLSATDTHERARTSQRRAFVLLETVADPNRTIDCGCQLWTQELRGVHELPERLDCTLLLVLFAFALPNTHVQGMRSYCHVCLLLLLSYPIKTYNYLRSSPWGWALPYTARANSYLTSQRQTRARATRTTRWVNAPVGAVQ